MRTIGLLQSCQKTTYVVVLLFTVFHEGIREFAVRKIKVITAKG